MSKEQQELLDEAYRKYADSHEYFVDGWLHVIPMEHSKETFIDKIKNDSEFSEKWGLTIEERELSDEERMKTLTKNEQRLIYERVQSFKNVRSKKLKDFLDEQNTPTKLITIKYNDQTIESYKMDGKLCYCGNPVDTSNPDCVTFNLCKEHQMDA